MKQVMTDHKLIQMHFSWAIVSFSSLINIWIINDASSQYVNSWMRTHAFSSGDPESAKEENGTQSEPQGEPFTAYFHL